MHLLLVRAALLLIALLLVPAALLLSAALLLAPAALRRGATAALRLAIAALLLAIAARGRALLLGRGLLVVAGLLVASALWRVAASLRRRALRISTLGRYISTLSIGRRHTPGRRRVLLVALPLRLLRWRRLLFLLARIRVPKPKVGQRGPGLPSSLRHRAAEACRAVPLRFCAC